jgi:IS30 family transposase
MDDDAQESTNRLLRVIVALLLRRKDEQTFTLREQIEILSDLGVKPAEIAEILGRTNTYIYKELSGIRKRNKKEK